MTITNAIKKVTKAGFTVTQNGQRYSAKKEGINYLVEFLLFALQDLRKAIYNPSPANDATTLGWLTQKIETLAQENTEQ
jgi:hypothetical protein